MKTLKLNGNIEEMSTKMYAFVNIGTTTKADDAVWKTAGDSGEADGKLFAAENVTYSVNKKGIVSIDKDGNVFALTKGKVTITAKTPMGKKATLTVTVE